MERKRSQEPSVDAQKRPNLTSSSDSIKPTGRSPKHSPKHSPLLGRKAARNASLTVDEPKEYILQRIERGDFSLIETAGSKTSVGVRQQLAEELIQLCSFSFEDTERLFIWACCQAVIVSEHPLELFSRKDFVSYEVLTKMESGVGGNWKKMLVEPVIRFLEKNHTGDLVIQAAGIFFDSLSDISVDIPVMVRQAWSRVHREMTLKWGEQRGVPYFLRFLLHEHIQQFIRYPVKSGVVEELPKCISQSILNQIADLIVDVSEQRVHEENAQLRSFVNKKVTVANQFYQDLIDDENIKIAKSIVGASMKSLDTSEETRKNVEDSFIRLYEGIMAEAQYYGSDDFCRLLINKMDNTKWKKSKSFLNETESFSTKDKEGQIVKTVVKVDGELTEVANFFTSAFGSCEFDESIYESERIQVSPRTYHSFGLMRCGWPLKERQWCRMETLYGDRKEIILVNRHLEPPQSLLEQKSKRKILRQEQLGGLRFQSMDDFTLVTILTHFESNQTSVQGKKVSNLAALFGSQDSDQRRTLPKTYKKIKA